MNHQDQNPIKNHLSSENAFETGEDTLQLIARLPAPAGLADRIHAGMLAKTRSQPQSAQNTGQVLAWPATARTGNGWMRSAAAAAIVFVVAGGGWGVYTRVQQPQAAKVIVMPHGPAPGEFTNAGAMRTPKTLNGPTVSVPAAAQLPKVKVPVKVAAKPAPLKSVRASAGNQAAAQAPAAK